MKQLILSSLLLASSAHAGEWVTLAHSDLLQIEMVQQEAFSFADEGVYFTHKTSFTTSENCPKKKYVAITDHQLATQVLSTAMFALKNNMTVRFYVDGCSKEYLHGKGAMLVPSS